MTPIKTTHVGSLPRSQAVGDMLVARERGDADDRRPFDAVMAAGVAETVRRQIAAGIDVVGDGETSKVFAYATDVKHRHDLTEGAALASGQAQ